MPAVWRRKFRQEALEKHVAACKKVFQTKRKEFDTKKHRVLNNEQVSLAKKQERKEKVQKNLKTKNVKGKAWKKDSEKLRDFINKKKEEMHVVKEGEIGEEEESMDVKQEDKMA